MEKYVWVEQLQHFTKTRQIVLLDMYEMDKLWLVMNETNKIKISYYNFTLPNKSNKRASY